MINFGNTQELFHKYCGETVFIVEKNGKNEELVEDLSLIAAPSHLLAISARNKEEEKKIIEHLLKEA